MFFELVSVRYTHRNFHHLASEGLSSQAAIILFSADGLGTHASIRRTGKLKISAWRWQERLITDGVDCFLRDKMRPSRILPLGHELAESVVALRQRDPLHEVTHRTAVMMA